MQIPLEIKFSDIDHSQWVEDYIRERAGKLDKMCDHLMSCRVVVEGAQHHHHTGNPWRVRVEVTMPPKKDLVADKEGTVADPHVQLRPIIRKAFEAMEKQIKKETARQRGDVKSHDVTNALVTQLYPEQDYGIIKSPMDGQEYHFHRNAVLHDDFDRLTPGTEVRFEAAMMEEGPRATTVQVIGKPGARPQTGVEEAEPPVDWDSNPESQQARPDPRQQKRE